MPVWGCQASASPPLVMVSLPAEVPVAPCALRTALQLSPMEGGEAEAWRGAAFLLPEITAVFFEGTVPLLILPKHPDRSRQAGWSQDPCPGSLATLHGAAPWMAWLKEPTCPAATPPVGPRWAPWALLSARAVPTRGSSCSTPVGSATPHPPPMGPPPTVGDLRGL